jgi:hypothetical protein
MAGAKLRIRKYLEEIGQMGKIKWTALNGGPFFDMCKYFSTVLNDGSA